MMVFFIYLLTLCISLGSSGVICSLVLMELLSWIFIQLLTSFNTIKYLLVQSVFFLFSLMSVLFMKPLLVIGFLLKMGLPPFHLWMLRLLASMKKNSFLITTTLHKLLPLFLLTKWLKESESIFTLSFLMMALSAIISNLSVLFLVLSMSSMSHSFWMVLSSLAAASLLSTYWVLYSSVSLLFIHSLSSEWMNKSEFSQSLITSLLWLLLCGIPPFMLFWLKAQVTTAVLLEMSILLAMLLLVGSVLILSAYYRAWHFSGFLVYTGFSNNLFNITVFLFILSAM